MSRSTLGSVGALTNGLARAGTGVGSPRTNRVAAAPGAVRVSVASHAVARAAGVDGLMVSVVAAGSGAVSVGVDYSLIADAYGAGFGSRLRLVRLPACALTTPQVAACRTQAKVDGAVNDLADQRLVTDLSVSAAPTDDAVAGAAGVGEVVVLATVSSPTGGGGDFKATPLSPSGSWSAGGSTGAFTYSYPITVPPPVGGSAPTVTLSYNSASVDGRTSATNNQASWLGDGWDYSPGFIERSYTSCDDDGHSGDFEQCWAGENATLSLGGHSNRLVPTGTNNQWRLRDDDGSVVDELSGGSNAMNSGTYWRVTTQDGTQYFFGANHLPSAAGGTGGDAATNAAWGVPVYGNDSGEPCHGSTFDTSRCTQGWRWNLDFVVDPHKNITVYSYTPETNYYAAGTTHTLVSYTRGGVLGPFPIL